MRSVRLTYGTGVAALALAATVAGCSSSGASSPAAAGPTSTPAATGTSSAASTTDFGSGCAAVPASGAGSFAGMTSAPVASAASNNPVLSTLVTAVKSAGLVDTLNGTNGITVFAPDNAAFAKIPSATLAGVLQNKAELTKILTYHVVSGRLSPGQLAGTHKTLEGGSITVAGSGQAFTVNSSADVVCGNVQTANATVYIISSVLMPTS